MSKRISWLDGWRGIAMYLMLVYHFSYDLYMFGWIGRDVMFSWPMELMQRFICYSFILCSGISSRFSRNNLKRGLWCAGAGILVIAGSYVAAAPIRFGILQCLSACMILYGLAGEWVNRVPKKIAPFLWIALFVLTKLWTDGAVVDVKWLYWLGFIYPGYVSYDHFALLPWLFLFLLGTWLGGWLQEHPELPILQKKAPAVLAWPGARTIWVYLAHQPVLYGLCLLVYIL